MPGEAQRNRAPHPLTVAQAIEQLQSMPPDDLLCVSSPGGPDRCVTGAVSTRGHTRLTTMPGWLPGTGTGTGVQRGDECNCLYSFGDDCPVHHQRPKQEQPDDIRDSLDRHGSAY